MTPERWTEVKAVFQAALAAADGERDRAIARACAGDEALRDEVLSLLEAYDGAGSFLSRCILRRSPTVRSGATLGSGWVPRMTAGELTN